MPGVSFDRAVEYYDATRGFAEGVAEQIRDALVAYLGATEATRFLELGVGTGRVALPFITAGYDYTGVDISAAMMTRLEEKLAVAAGSRQYRYRLLEADVTRQLPFADGSFDAILAVLILHVVDNWRGVLDEARRVLAKPQGRLLLALDDRAADYKAEHDPIGLVQSKWDEILRGLRIDTQSLRVGSWLSSGQLEEYLHSQDATTELITLTRFDHRPLTMRQMAQRHVDRVHSSDWTLSEQDHAEATAQLQEWVAAQGEVADQPVIRPGEFKVLAARWLEE